MAQNVSSTPLTEREIAAMAAVLKRRYGARAGEIARHFEREHETIGDHARAGAWSAVQLRLECTVHV